jgi:hypothetical protein
VGSFGLISIERLSGPLSNGDDRASMPIAGKVGRGPTRFSMPGCHEHAREKPVPSPPGNKKGQKGRMGQNKCRDFQMKPHVHCLAGARENDMRTENSGDFVPSGRS